MPNRPLLLTVSADTSPLQRALEAGRSTLSEFGLSASTSVAQVEEAFSQLAAQPANAARQMEASFALTVRNMQSAAQEAMKLGSGYNPLGGMNAKSSADAAAQLENLAQIERDRAAAAAAATASDAQEAQALRVLATASTAAALSFEEQAGALRAQASVLGLVESEMENAGTATRANQAAQSGLHETTNRLNLGQMELAHVARASADAWAAGIPISRIAAMEMGRLTEAMAFYAQQSGATTGIMGKFASVMSGPWGIALTLGIPLLSSLVGHLLEADHALKDATDKLKKQGEQAKITADAQAIYDKSLDGIIAKETKLAETLERQLKTREQLNREQIAGAVADVASSQKSVEDARREYAAAVKERDDYKKNPPNYNLDDGGASAIAGQAYVDKKVADAQKKLADATTALASSRRAQLAAEAADARYRANTLASPNGKEKLALDEREQRNTDAFLGKWSNDPTPKLLKAPSIDLDAFTKEQMAIERERAKLSKSSNGSASDQATVGDMVALLKQLIPGVRITSTTGGKHVDGSDHYAGRAIDFVPPGGMNEFTSPEMLKMLEGAGIKIRRGSKGNLQFFGPGMGPKGPGDHSHDDHFHVAWEGRPSPESANRIADERQRKQEESAAAFVAEGDNLDKQLAQAKRKRLDTIEDQYKADVDALDAEKKAAYDRIDKEAKEHGWTDNQTKLLKLKEDEVDAAKRDAVERDKKEKLDRRMAEDARFAADISTQLLNLQLDMATTLKERRDIMHKLLKIERDQAIAAIDADKTLTDQQKEERKAQTDKVFGVRDNQIDKQGDPLQDWMHRAHQNTDDMNAALKGVAADGLQSLEDGLVGIITGTESVASAFKKMAAAIIADLARIAIEKLILKVFSFSDGGEASGYAVGGFIEGPGGSREDKIPARLSAGEFVVNASATARHRKLLNAINDNKIGALNFANGGFVDPASIAYPAIPSASSLSPRGQGAGQAIVFDLRGAVMTEDLLHQMNAISARHATAAMVAGPDLARANISASQRRIIPT